MIYFVTEHVQTSLGKSVERSIRKGGYGSIMSAARAAIRKGNCYIRGDNRQIIGQTINANLPMFVCQQNLYTLRA